MIGFSRSTNTFFSLQRLIWNNILNQLLRKYENHVQNQENDPLGKILPVA
jgi:hypothetical protein